MRENTPLYAIECEEITRAVKRLGVMLLGGKIQILIRISALEGSYIEIFTVSYIGNFVNSYKAIKRHHLDRAIQIINEEYSIPTVLNEEITVKNSQINMADIQ